MPVLTTASSPLQVRSWLTALMRLSLVNGSLQDGLLMHDIVRDFAISRCPDLLELHRKLLFAALDATPAAGWPTLSQAKRGTLEWYINVHAPHHMRATISAAADDDNDDPLPAMLMAEGRMAGGVFRKEMLTLGMQCGTVLG